MGTYYKVRQGDCLSSISKQYGFSDYNTIYQHPENAAFREKRANPNIIYPGDIVFIPDLTPKEHPCATDQTHTFEKKIPEVFLRLCLKDDQDRPYQNIKYQLSVGFNDYDGSTDGAGLVEQKIPADATQGSITIFPNPNNRADLGYTFTLSLGELDPIEETSGVDARLINLGFGPPGSSAEQLSDEERTEAIKAFQERQGLEITGQADDATQSKLRELHDAE